MKKEIILHNKKVFYTLQKSKRSRRMCMTLHSDGSIMVTTPLRIPMYFIEKFIKEKSKWLFSKMEYFSKFKNIGNTRYDKVHYLAHKKDALNVAVERVEYFSALYGYAYHKINIRNQKTRWGSCSKKGNVSFNYKILFLPEALRDYIVVHELCHLKEFNHSNKFWDLVARVFPNYLEIKKQLKEKGLSLR